MLAVKDAIEKAENQKQNVFEMPIEFATNQNGNPKPNSLRNCGLVLEHDDHLRKMLAFNEFTFSIDIVRDINDLGIQRGPIDDDYSAEILRYIEDKYDILFPEKILNMAISNDARKNKYNPVRNYLDKCFDSWDNTERLPDLLPDFLGVEKGAVTTLQTDIFMRGAVAKAYEPTTKFDMVLDLVGGQGAGKTTFLKRISRGWYTDQFTDFKDKDSYSTMLRAWIVNDDEMTATNNSDFENLKKFVSAEELEYRPPYGRHTVRRPKNFVLARTTNETTYLKDKTGERRFMPNLVDKERQKRSPITDMPPDLIAQIWGEAVARYKNRPDFLLTEREQEILEEHRNNFMYIDQIEEEIETFLANTDRDFVTSANIAFGLGEENLVGNRTLAKKIKYVMDNHKGWKAGAKKYGKTAKRGYRRR